MESDRIYVIKDGDIGGGLVLIRSIDARHPQQWPTLMNGSGNSACYYEAKLIKKLYLGIKEIEETTNRSHFLLKGWDFIGILLLCALCVYLCIYFVAYGGCYVVSSYTLFVDVIVKFMEKQLLQASFLFPITGLIWMIGGHRGR